MAGFSTLSLFIGPDLEKLCTGDPGEGDCKQECSQGADLRKECIAERLQAVCESGGQMGCFMSSGVFFGANVLALEILQTTSLFLSAL
ncbi:unnamed protein product [Caretta caretta]